MQLLQHGQKCSVLIFCFNNFLGKSDSSDSMKFLATSCCLCYITQSYIYIEYYLMYVCIYVWKNGQTIFVSIFFAFLSVLVASHTIIDRSKVTSVSDSGKICFIYTFLYGYRYIYIFLNCEYSYLCDKTSLKHRQLNDWTVTSEHYRRQC